MGGGLALGVALAALGARYAAAESAAPLPWLRAQGPRIVDEKGNTVVLRGVNLGGWLVEEMWMMPFVTQPPDGSGFQPVRDHVSLQAVLEKRFGRAGAQELLDAQRRAWLTEADFDRIKAAGLNSVRLPFLHDLFAEPQPWQWLDWAIREAGRRGLYVILDLHGAPGRQSKDHHSGEQGVNRFFRDPARVAETERLWARIARRYRDNPTVAAYDLLNEPMGAPNTSTLYLVQDRLYRAIRKVDPRHLIVVEEGYTGLEPMPYPAVCGWSNVVLSFHAYQFDAKSEQNHLGALAYYTGLAEKTQAERQAPLYLGEFNLEPHGTPETLRAFLTTLNQHNWSWAVWTYKVVMRRGDASQWGLYRNEKPVEPLDPFRDSREELLRKMAQLRTERLNEYAAVAEVYRSAR